MESITFPVSSHHELAVPPGRMREGRRRHGGVLRERISYVRDVSECTRGGHSSCGSVTFQGDRRRAFAPMGWVHKSARWERPEITVEGQRKLMTPETSCCCGWFWGHTRELPQSGTLPQMAKRSSHSISGGFSTLSLESQDALAVIAFSCLSKACDCSLISGLSHAYGSRTNLLCTTALD